MGAPRVWVISLDALFAQRMNAVNPKFLGMVRDILRFNKNALELAKDLSITVAEFLEKLGTGVWFRDYYLLPLSGAIWSTPTQKIMDFPAHAMIQFFENHALLNTTGQHQWYTVDGGSIEYVRLLEAALVSRGVDIRLKSPVQAVRRDGGVVQVKAAGGEWEAFDQVILVRIRMILWPCWLTRRLKNRQHLARSNINQMKSRCMQTKALCQSAVKLGHRGCTLKMRKCQVIKLT